MQLLTSIAERAFRMAGAVPSQRSYAAAKNNRLVGDWTSQNNSANQEIKMSLRTLRARSRQLARDNDYFIGFLKKLEANVVGQNGLKLQVDAKNADGQTKKEPLNRKVEDEWAAWSRKNNCDVTGQGSFRDIAALAIRTLAVDGEFLVRYIGDPNSEFGLKLQVIDVDWLDEDYNDPKPQSGNRIIMSVELDSFDKPVAYWLTPPRWSNVLVGEMPIVPNRADRLRVPAEMICHRFLKTRIGQVRGLPWAHGAMLSLNQLDGFDEAELVGARIAASNMAFVSPPPELDGGSSTSLTPIDTEVTPGQVLELPPGYTVSEFSPTKPLASDFSKRILRKVAASFGINYNTMTSDLEGVNFSSIRAGTIEEREIWKMLHVWMANHFYQDVYQKWLMFNLHLAPVTQMKQVMYPIWRGRGFDWVDPSKDVTADIDAVNRGFKTMTEVLAEKGRDFEETMEQHAAEKVIIEKLGLEFASPDMQAKLAADASQAAEGGGQDAGKAKKKAA